MFGVTHVICINSVGAVSPGPAIGENPPEIHAPRHQPSQAGKQAFLRVVSGLLCQLFSLRGRHSSSRVLDFLLEMKQRLIKIQDSIEIHRLKSILLLDLPFRAFPFCVHKRIGAPFKE